MVVSRILLIIRFLYNIAVEHTVYDIHNTSRDNIYLANLTRSMKQKLTLFDYPKQEVVCEVNTRHCEHWGEYELG